MGRKRKRQKEGKKRSPRTVTDLKFKVLQVFESNPEEAFSYRQVLKLIGIRDMKSKEKVKEIIFDLESQEHLRRNREGRWIIKAAAKKLTGIVDHVNPRFAYVMIPDMEEDVWIKSDNMNFAIDGDEVNIQITKGARHGNRPEGRIINVVKRAREEFVGRIEISPKFAFVIPDSRNIHFDIMVFPENLNGARHNDKVLVKVERWHDRSNKSPVGAVSKVLGQAGEHEAEIHSIMAEFELPFEFPKSVEKAAKQIPDEINLSTESYRRDFRKVTTFTIDPDDAKDFDDALSINKLENGNLEIGIHIADVSHYVKPDSILDQEAYNRATSVYLVDRTIPMLPEKLSNGLCSLRPHEEKLTFSAAFEIDSKGNVRSRWFGRAMIYSDRRFTYEEAQERIEKKAGDFSEEVNTLNELAHQLRKNRFEAGAVNFETVEVKFLLDKKGKPLKVVPKERKDAHKLVEEFMLLANREVATFIFNKGKNPDSSPTFVYRTHDDPDPEKLQNFAIFANRFGHKFDMNGNLSKNLNNLLDEIEGKPEQNVLESIAIRAMAKAKYTTNPVGHFGLAFEHYTHFTSPIRRYPDVMVHRLLWEYLQGGKSPDKEPIEKQCIHSSEREKRAADAERASIKYKQVEFMQQEVGNVFEGLVSGVTEWGVFVEIIETRCEGMIRISDLDDDYYEFDEKNFRIIGRNNKRIISLGDKLDVLVLSTDIDRRTIDLDLVTDISEED